MKITLALYCSFSCFLYVILILVCLFLLQFGYLYIYFVSANFAQLFSSSVMETKDKTFQSLCLRKKKKIKLKVKEATAVETVVFE